MASKSTIEVVIEAITDNLTKGVDKVEDDLKDLGKAAENASKGTNKFETAMGGIGKAIGGLVEAGIIAKAGDMLIGFMKDSVVEAEAAAKAQAQLEAVITSTGGAAGITADQVNELADTLSKATGVEDDLIIKNSALMLTFTKVSSKVFPDAIDAALNMSAVMGTDLQSSIIQVGKALQDPIEGVTALRRVGVNLTDSQRDLIRTMMDSGQIMEAQQLILDELTTEFGGAAEAMHDAGSGADTWANSVGNLKEALGSELLPVVKDTTEAASGWVDSLTNAIDVEHALKEARDDGIVSWKEVQEQLNKMMFTSYSAADASDWLRKRIEDTERSTNKWSNSIDENRASLDENKKAIDNATTSGNQLETQVARLSDITAQYSDKLLYNKIAQNLDEEAAVELGREWGILDERTLALISGVDRLNQIYDTNRDGVISAEEATRQYKNAVDDLRTSIENMKDKTVHVNVITHNTTGGVHAPGAGRAAGGPVNQGTPYMVGERGPELFVPMQSGFIVPNHVINNNNNFSISLTGTGTVGQDITSTVRLLELLYG